MWALVPNMMVLLMLQAATGSSAAKETPQERLKRLMQAQLNKAAQKDSLANAHKKIQVCKGVETAWQEALLVLGSSNHWRLLQAVQACSWLLCYV